MSTSWDRSLTSRHQILTLNRLKTLSRIHAGHNFFFFRFKLFSVYSRFSPSSNLCLAMCKKAKQAVNAGVKNRVYDQRNNYWQRQGVSSINTGACHNATERCVKGIGDSKNKLCKARTLLSR